jgi:DNA replication protein DnaC
MTSCSLAGGRHERAWACAGSARGRGALQAASPAHRGWPVRVAGRGRAPGAPELPGLSGCPPRGELEEREQHTIQRRLRDAHLPKGKTLEEFDFSQAPLISATQLWELAEGGYIERTEPIGFIGDCGTGKTHLLTALCVAACRQKRRVRFTTTAALVNEPVEAKQQLELRRTLARWERYDFIAIDEVGYVPLAEMGPEFLFQVIADRSERKAVILTTNLPFSEWTQVIPNPRLCKALLDRITDRAHLIETGTESYRFRRTLEKRTRKG